MKTFPMFLKMENRHVVFVGGDEEAARKVRLILRTEAEILICAERLDAELAALVASGRAAHHPGAPAAHHFTGAALAFVATGDEASDTAAADLARAAGVPVNVVDRPELCDAFTPSIVDRDPLVIAIGTEGTAPVLARQVRTRLEEMLEPRLGHLAALAGRMRGLVEQTVPKENRRRFWAWAFNGGPRALHARGAEAEAARLLKEAAQAGHVPDGGRGSIALVGAGPGARDLLTLRAVQRLQEADVIFYDRLVDPEVLDLARRDADRVFVGKEVGAHAWPQDRINGVIVAAARRGQRVVRLKSGDPGIFGRASEELEAARAEGIPVEIVPGITAASAASASMGRPLTERGATDRLVIATGTCRPGDADPDWGALATPGTTLALYMAMGKLGPIVRSMAAAGVEPGTEVSIVSEASSPRQQSLTTTLGRVVEEAAAAGLAAPAIIFVRRDKRAAAQGAATRAVA